MRRLPLIPSCRVLNIPPRRSRRTSPGGLRLLPLSFDTVPAGVRSSRGRIRANLECYRHCLYCLRRPTLAVRLFCENCERSQSAARCLKTWPLDSRLAKSLCTLCKCSLSRTTTLAGDSPPLVAEVALLDSLSSSRLARLPEPVVEVHSTATELPLPCFVARSPDDLAHPRHLPTCPDRFPRLEPRYKPCEC